MKVLNLAFYRINAKVSNEEENVTFALFVFGKMINKSFLHVILRGGNSDIHARGSCKKMIQN